MSQQQSLNQSSPEISEDDSSEEDESTDHETERRLPVNKTSQAVETQPNAGDELTPEEIRELRGNPRVQKLLQAFLSNSIDINQLRQGDMEKPPCTKSQRKSGSKGNAHMRGNAGTSKVRYLENAKSPSDTTIYAPALNKETDPMVLARSSPLVNARRRSPQVHVNQISNFVDQMRLEADKAMTSQAGDNQQMRSSPLQHRPIPVD